MRCFPMRTHNKCFHGEKRKLVILLPPYLASCIIFTPSLYKGELVLIVALDITVTYSFHDDVSAIVL